jgi:outer membrane receptor protein involved in Fe transport
MALALALGVPASSQAQTTGLVLGRVTDAVTGQPLQAVEVSVEGLRLRALTSERGEFILAAVPTGERELRVRLLGYRTATLSVLVRAGRTLQVTIELTPAPLEVEGVAAEVERTRLIEPEVAVTHEVMLGRELVELPVDNVEQVVELTTGVSGGHFRGGRVGQETYRIDGLEVKNQFEGSTQGPLLEVAPTALEEVEVVTGGTRPEYGSALSGAVSYVTRRGNRNHWQGRAALFSDHWLPDDLFRGFSGLSLTLDGPLPFLGDQSTLLADLLAQGMVDSDPRGRGLTCLRPEDGDIGLAEAINTLASDPSTAHLYCPYTAPRLPYQRGDKLIGFLRFDSPLSAGTNLTLSLLYNRRERELYTPAFKYNPVSQLGQRTKAYLATLTLDWARQRQGRAYHLIARAAASRLNRYLGALDPWTFEGRARIAGFGLQSFRFLGEEFTRLPIEEQVESGLAVPGYVRPGGFVGSPFGPAAEGIFFTEGTPDIANWNRTDFVGGDLIGEILSARGHALRAGASARFYRVENYERVLAYLPGSSPNYARFYPTTVNGWVELSVLAADDVTAQVGARYEAFRSGLSFQEDRSDLLSPVIDTKWRSLLMPRIAVAIPIPLTDDRTMIWFNYGKVAQPPDFRFLLDSTIGDSLRADIKRQGNPNLAFEQGSAFEFGLRHLLSDDLAFSAAVFVKELSNLVTSSVSFPNTPANQFTTGDFGTVKGLELSLRGHWPAVRLRAGYALQEAVGVSSTAFERLDSATAEQRVEFPLAFDRRHAADFSLLLGRAAGAPGWRLGASLTGSLRSGFPVDRRLAAGRGTELPHSRARLPWTGDIDLRLSYEVGGLRVCRPCAWRLLLDIRNVLDRENVIALRRDTGALAPERSKLEAVAAELSDQFVPIPFESPRYSALADLNGDGVIALSEFEAARFAAALDASDPSLYFGEPIQVRLGVEVSF